MFGEVLVMVDARMVDARSYLVTLLIDLLPIELVSFVIG